MKSPSKPGPGRPLHKGNALRILRLRRGVSVAACAKAAGISSSGWYRRETRWITAPALAEWKAEMEQACMAELGGIQLDIEMDTIRRF